MTDIYGYPTTAEEAIQKIDSIMREVLCQLNGEFPRDVLEKVKDIAFVVRLEATKEQKNATHPDVEAIFQGIPLKYPAIITLFAGRLLRSNRTDEMLYKQIRKDLLHEIGHFFGMDHKALKEIGLMNELDR